VTWRATRIEEITDESGAAHIRRHFGIGSFGVNASIAREDGATLVPEHAEDDTSGQEELYLVVAGNATFVLDGGEVDAREGTLVFAPPGVRRTATGRAGTTVLAVGATPGKAYVPTGWEIGAPALPLLASGDYVGAKAILVAGLEEFPESPLMLYNLACAEARLGARDEALGHLARAAELDPRFGEYARTDDDLESIRDAPEFPS
jgi:mannose-6-phosphate isomerase-like protein (cupin superfamily)